MNAIDTLPDLLRDALQIVFVGINPSLYSVERGHYFARRSKALPLTLHPERRRTSSIGRRAFGTGA